MTIEQIFHIVCGLVRRHGTRDPMRILKERGILMLFQDMGKRPDSCKGFYLHQDRIGCVTINSALGVDMQRIIAAHELGHALLHKTAAQDFCVFDDASRLEY